MLARLAHFWRHLGAGTRLLLTVWLLVSVTSLVLPGALWSPLNGLRLRDGTLASWQLWRLPGHALGADDLMSILTGGFLLAWLGSDLEHRWDAKWFLTFYTGCAAATGLALAAFSFDRAGDFCGNTGAVFGLLVAWAVFNRGQPLRLFGGPEVSATFMAVLIGLSVLIPALLSGNPARALALAAGAGCGWLLLHLRHVVAGRRADRDNERPRMTRLEL